MTCRGCRRLRSFDFGFLKIKRSQPAAAPTLNRAASGTSVVDVQHRAGDADAGQQQQRQRAVTRLAALHRTDDDLVRIRGADAAYLEAVSTGDFQAMSETNKALHMAIAEAGKNPYFINYYGVEARRAGRSSTRSHAIPFGNLTRVRPGKSGPLL